MVCFWRCSQNHSFQQWIKQIIQVSINIWLIDISKSNMHKNRLNSAVFSKTALLSLFYCILFFEISINHILIDNWIICLMHCWKLWFCEHLQKHIKKCSNCTLWSKNFGNPRLWWKLILLDGYFNLAFLSTKKLEFHWFPEKLDWIVQF